ncbi:hypothetical protein MTBBW1_1680057 [Desulfamplus magnetovallimortis]|uniref:AprE-like beta-barrel domain-containing protein n=1 Tax=Desulfamplus magnetovallimortis TaxID=1246637 RepID=A0A1W1H9Q3_9BACT|nr:HlyD family efflux transporter periplasmic adaptor subunit [Desulfamplus magnetovallimortis]SLM29145.1 hypothetical protein MTBBW1_1680057 [Desulfamplus magnetovallimortis]
MLSTNENYDNFFVVEQLKRMPSIYARGILYIIFLAIISILFYSALCKVDIIREGSAIVRPLSHEMQVVSEFHGFIDKISIENGAFVDEGDLLFTIKTRINMSQYSELKSVQEEIEFKKGYYKSLIDAMETEIEYLKDELENMKHSFALSMEKISISLEQVQSDFTYWKKEIENRKQEFLNTQILFKKQLTSIAEYNSVKGRLELAKTEVKKLDSQKRIFLKEKDIIAQNIKKTEAEKKNQENIIDKKIENILLEQKNTMNSLQAKLRKLQNELQFNGSSKVNALSNEKTGEYNIFTPKSGIVSRLFFLNKGEYVNPSTVLCTVIPADEPYYMDITVANKDIGFIEVDMPVKYKFDAFPHRDYGTINGYVIAISPSAIEEKHGVFVYKVKGALNNRSFNVHGRSCPLKPGMTAVAEMITEKKSLLSIFYNKVSAFKTP